MFQGELLLKLFSVIRTDIQLAAGALQICAGHDTGAEAAIHAMREIFTHENTDAVLLVDASNASNQVNRQSALHNISILCPSFATILKNTYGVPIRLFITGEGEITSTEGTTQGDLLAMAMYVLAVIPLIRSLRQSQPDVSQVWYADDVTAGGQLASSLHWWKHLLAYGPMYCYFPNAAKTCLIVKPDQLNLLKHCLMALIYRFLARVNVTWVLLLELDHLQKAMSLTK